MQKTTSPTLENFKNNWVEISNEKTIRQIIKEI